VPNDQICAAAALLESHVSATHNGGDARTLQLMICYVLSQTPGTAAPGSALGAGHCACFEVS